MRREQAIRRTVERRPDLIAKAALTPKERELAKKLAIELNISPQEDRANNTRLLELNKADIEKESTDGSLVDN